MAAFLQGAVLLAIASPGAAADRLPDWAREALAAPVGADTSGANAIVYLDELRVTVERADRYRAVHRRIARVVTSAGANEAVASVYYRTDGDKIRSLSAWTVGLDGSVRRLADKEAVDRAVLDEAVYSEARVRVLVPSTDLRPGMIFAYESDTEHRSPFTQFDRSFQEDVPVLVSRFAVTPPDGWNVEFTVAHGDSFGPRLDGTARVWELRDLPAVKEEPLRPSLHRVSPLVAVNLVPPQGASDEGHRIVRRWEDASAWQASEVAALGGPGDRVRAKAAALIAGAATEEEKIRAIATFTQSVNYVSINMGLGRGGGYVPHPAADVLARLYGDCKDKANLMRSLLESVGIESYLVGIRADGGDAVLPEYPALGQFDHCIVAVRTDTSADAAVRHPSLGRLVLFDPTDPITPWGSLPPGEYDAWALPVAPEGAALVRAPPAPPRSHRRARRIEGALDASGTLAGSINLDAKGSAASEWRWSLRERGSKEVERERSWWLGPSSSAASVDSFAIVADSGIEFRLRARFRLPNVGTPMAGLMILETGRWTTLRLPSLPDTPRVCPLDIPADYYEEEISLRLPPGYAPDEMPSPVSIDSPYGAVRAEVKAEEGTLTIRRSLERRKAHLPPAAYGEVRRFYSRARDAFRFPIALARR